MKRLSTFSETDSQGPEVGSMVRSKGRQYVVESVETERVEDGYTLGLPIDDGYRHRLVCSPATREQIVASTAAGRKAELTQQLRSLAVDDERDRDRIEEERRRIRTEIAKLS